MSSSTSAPARASAARQREVVGRGVGRRIDQLHAHRAPFSLARRPIPFRRWSRAPWSAPSSPLLVLATVGAFFVTQSLKTEIPLVLRFGAQPRDISPNGDRVRDFSARRASTSPRPPRCRSRSSTARATEVRRLVDDRELAGRPQVPLPLGRPRRRGQRRARRHLPPAGRRGARRAAWSTRSRRCGSTPGRRGSSIASVEPNVIVPGRAARGAHPLPRPAQQGAGVPRLPHRRRRAAGRRGCSAATRAAPASGTAPCAAAASRPTARTRST